MKDIVYKSPNFLIVGEQKAGTTYLYHNLKNHPDIFMSPTKEPMYFSLGKFEISEFSKYLFDNFRAAGNEKWRGEASTLYFHAEQAAERILQALGREVRIIACLRHPLEKAVSLYLHNYRRGRLRGDEQLISVFSRRRLSPLLYHADACARFLYSFGQQNVRYIDFELLKRGEAGKFVGEALMFLDLQAVRKPIATLINKGSTLRWEDDTLTIRARDVPRGKVRPYFPESELEALHKRLYNDIERTETITKIDLSHWKRLPTDW